MDLLSVDERMTRAMTDMKKSKESSFTLLAAKLNALSPLSVLTRGYSFVSDGEGKVLKNAHGLNVGQKVRISFADGEAGCRVEDIKTK